MEKKKQLLYYLISQSNNESGWVKGNKISSQLNISLRTISNYINELNKEYDNIIISSNRGYTCDKSKIKNMDFIPESIAPSNADERKQYLLEKLLFKSETLKMSQLANYFCISPSTLNNEIARLRVELKDEDLYIKTKHDSIYLIGKDKDCRRFALKLLDRELEKNNFDITAIQKNFKKSNLKELQQIVISTIHKYEYYLDDYSLFNYVLHLAICIEMFTPEKNTISFKNNNPKFKISGHITCIVNEIYDQIKEKYNVNVSSEQMFDASMLMITRIVSEDINKATLSQLDELVSEDIKNMLVEIINNVHQIYGLDFKSESLLIRFGLHLKNLMTRLENHKTISANQFVSVKNDYPFLYLVAVYISSIISKHIHKALPEEEIAYIAIHLGILIEENKSIKEKVRCVLVILDYLDMSKNILRTLNENFKNLVILDCITNYADVEEISNVDMILTTFKPNINTTIPQIQISPLISENDLDNIEAKIKEINRQKSINTIIEKIKYFFSEDIFFYNQKFSTRDDALTFMCDQMYKAGYVSASYRNGIYQHELIASSAYNNIAIPHPLDSNASISKIAISINPKPVKWGNNDVNFIFMLSLKPEDSLLFKDIFEFIIKIFNKEDNVNRILQCRTFDEFLNEVASSNSDLIL